MEGEDARRLAELRFLEQQASRMFGTAASRIDDPEVGERFRIMRMDHQRHVARIDDLFFLLADTPPDVDEGFKVRVRSMAGRAEDARVPEGLFETVSEAEAVLSDFVRAMRERDLPAEVEDLLRAVASDEVAHGSILAMHELVPAGWRDI